MSRIVVPLLAVAALTGCASSATLSDTPASAPGEAASRQNPADAITEAAVIGGNTTAAAAILAGKVVAEGAETAGRTVGTFFWDGPAAAEREWNHGARSTRVVAREQARYTSETAKEGGPKIKKPAESPAQDEEPTPALP